MKDLLKDQVAIVTGGTAGIGKSIALKFAEHGAQVIIFGTNKDRGGAVLNEMHQAAGHESAQFYQVDVSNTAEVGEAIKKVLEKYRQVDVLVNNAGITCDQLLMKMSEDEWDKVMDINVKSCYNTAHALVRPMMKAKKGQDHQYEFRNRLDRKCWAS